MLSGMKITLMLIVCAVASATGVSLARQQEPVTISYGDVSWSPDGRWLSFTQFTNTGVKMTPTSLKLDIFVVQSDGTGLQRVTSDAKNNAGANWAKDGKRLYFVASIPGQMADRKIYSIKLDGSDVTELRLGPGPNANPSLSPDGKRLVYNCGSQICVADVDGSHVRSLTNDTTLKFFDPKWSPDGKAIAYYVEKGDQKDQIWTMNADGKNERLLTNNVGHNYYPTWSADGTRLMFSSDRDGTRALYTMNADGTNIQRFVEKASTGRFSPDGKRLALVMGGRTDSRIVVANADGTNQITILPK